MKRIVLSLAGFVTLFGLTAPPAQSTPSAITTLQMQAQLEATAFSGTIVKTGENFLLNDAVAKAKYMFDNQDKLSHMKERR
jgi:hypothetical protein